MALGYEQSSKNLKMLLRERFRFIRKNIKPNDRVLEIGSGNGWSKHFLDDVVLIRTDCEAQEWIETVASGEKLPFASGSFDAVICIAALHHMDFPVLALREMSRVLKPFGKALIVEPHVSLLLRLALFMTRHEYIDSSIDPYSGLPCLTRPGNNWSGNNAIGDGLFRDLALFRSEFPEFNVVEHRFTEAVLLMNSGGIYQKTPYIPLPESALSLCARIDRFVCRWAPDIFAICRELVLVKNR